MRLVSCILLSYSQSLYYIIGNYHIRVLVLSMQEKAPYTRMANLRPVPSAFVAFGSTREGIDYYSFARAPHLCRGYFLSL